MKPSVVPPWEGSECDWSQVIPVKAKLVSLETRKPSRYPPHRLKYLSIGNEKCKPRKSHKLKCSPLDPSAQTKDLTKKPDWFG
jgi:hypothetical protein